MRERTDLSTHAYASEGARKSDRLLAYSRCWDEQGSLQLGIEDDTQNFVEVQRGLGNIRLIAHARIEGFLVPKINMITRRVSCLTC